MPRIQEVQDQDGVTVEGAYRKVSTEGDVFRVAAAESGKRMLISGQDSSGRIAWGMGFADVTLDFIYLVGVNELDVAVVDPVTGLGRSIVNKAALDVAVARPGAAIPSSMNPANAAFKAFAEVSPDVVRIYNLQASAVVMASVPHTATPPSLSARVSVQRQGDNIAVNLLGEGDGVLMKAPNGRTALVRLENNLKINVVPR